MTAPGRMGKLAAAPLAQPASRPPMVDQNPQMQSRLVASQTAAATSDVCFHCGEPLPDDGVWATEIDGTARPMCCAGCQAVAQTIVDAGLGEYYRVRTELPARADDRVPSILEQARAYERPALTRAYTRSAGVGARETHLMLDGIECAACAWLVERTLIAQPGVLEAEVNFSTHRARVRFDTERTGLGRVLESVGRLGYAVHPYDPERREAALESERRGRLRRLGVAGLFGMQIMMVAVALYAGDWWGMQPAFERLFRWLSLALALPIVGYAAAPFFRAAWRGIVHGAPGMDVPVSLGIAVAFVASVHSTVTGDGHVYYDSVAMFTFFLLLARYLEFVARKRAAERIESLVAPVPALARRVDENARGHSCRWRSSVPAIGCAFCPARAFRPTAPCSQEGAASTSRF